jgi:Lysozyme like domain
MAKLAIPQLISLASGAGFSGDDLVTAVAIAVAESGGDPQAYNPEQSAGAAQGRGSFGLWQIYLTDHPEFAGENLLDPQTNAAAAYAVYAGAGNSFRPWSTYKSGAYLANVAAVTQALGSNPDVVASSGDGGPSSSSDLLTLVIAGGLALWAVGRLLGW